MNKPIRIDKGGFFAWCLPRWTEKGLCHAFFEKYPNVQASTEDAGCAIANFFGDTRQLRLLKQVHGKGIVEGREDSPVSERPIADGWIVPKQNHVSHFGILTADCIPVLLVSFSPAVAAILHCGWRGAVLGILQDALTRFSAFGASPLTTEMAIGPGAGSCCYQVGENFSTEMLALSRDIRLPVERRGEILFCDIKGFLRQQGENAGLKSENIVQVEACTICSTNFFSVRREKALAGRQVSVISW